MAVVLRLVTTKEEEEEQVISEYSSYTALAQEGASSVHRK